MILAEVPRISFAQFESFIARRLEHNPKVRAIALAKLRRPYPKRTSHPDGDDPGGENNLGWIEKLIVQFLFLIEVDRTAALAALVGAIGWIRAYAAVPRDAGHMYADGVLLALDLALKHPELIDRFAAETGVTAKQLAELCEKVLRKAGADMAAKLDAYKSNRRGAGAPRIRYVSNALKTCADCARASLLVGDLDWRMDMVAAVRKHARWFLGYPFEHIDFAIGWGQAADGTWFQCDLIERDQYKWNRLQKDGTTSPRTGYHIPYQRHFTQFEAIEGILPFLEGEDLALAKSRIDALETQWWGWDYVDDDNPMHRGTGPTNPFPVFHPLAKEDDPIVLARPADFGKSTGEMLYQFWHYVLRNKDRQGRAWHESRMLEGSTVQGEQHWPIWPPTLWSEGLLRLAAMEIEEEAMPQATPDMSKQQRLDLARKILKDSKLEPEAALFDSAVDFVGSVKEHADTIAGSVADIDLQTQSIASHLAGISNMVIAVKKDEASKADRAAFIQKNYAQAVTAAQESRP